MSKIIIFTDLDGSLLHPKTYSFEDARPAMMLIEDKGIPLILCSSKTRAEIEAARKMIQGEMEAKKEEKGDVEHV